MSEFARIAAEVATTLGGIVTAGKGLAQRAMSIHRDASAIDKDAEWQRVNSYIADILKDSHVLYAKLARIQSDFTGAELDRLMQISEAVLAIGEELSQFSKEFYNGRLEMAETEFSYGGENDGSEVFQPFGDSGEQAPGPQAPAEEAGGGGQAEGGGEPPAQQEAPAAQEE